MSKLADAMQAYLPKYTKIIKSHDLIYSTTNSNEASINFETVEIRTKDLIHAFEGIKREAEERLYREKKTRKREEVRHRIERSVWFNGYIMR